jgi:hypothetical protein
MGVWNYVDGSTGETYLVGALRSIWPGGHHGNHRCFDLVSRFNMGCHHRNVSMSICSFGSTSVLMIWYEIPVMASLLPRELRLMSLGIIGINLYS